MSKLINFPAIKTPKTFQMTEPVYVDMVILAKVVNREEPLSALGDDVILASLSLLLDTMCRSGTKLT